MISDREDPTLVVLPIMHFGLPRCGLIHLEEQLVSERERHAGDLQTRLTAKKNQEINQLS